MKYSAPEIQAPEDEIQINDPVLIHSNNDLYRYTVGVVLAQIAHPYRGQLYEVRVRRNDGLTVERYFKRHQIEKMHL